MGEFSTRPADISTAISLFRSGMGALPLVETEMNEIALLEAESSAAATAAQEVGRLLFCLLGDKAN